MADKIFLEVKIGSGTPLPAVRSVTINQAIFAHHTFEVVLPSTSIASTRGALFDKLPSLIGEAIVIDWESGLAKKDAKGTDHSMFKGIIMDVSVSGQHQDHLYVTLSGKSPTTLMDVSPNSETYSGVGLKELYDLANGSNLQDSIKAQANLTYTKKIPFAVQYAETDFDFLCRMMLEHGEWFYYDGQTVQLGLRSQPAVSITSGRLRSLDLRFTAVRPEPTMAAWDYLSNKKLEIKSKAPELSDNTASKVYNKAKDLFPAGEDVTVNQPFPSIADGDQHQPAKADLTDAMARAGQARANDTFMLVGVSDVAEIQVGTAIKLDNAFYAGEYVVTSVVHSCQGNDNYENLFRAVPKGAGVPGAMSFAAPRLESSLAMVTDNKDPKKMGRVRVKFPWGSADSPWLRVLWPHAGKDRGFYFVPEKGDEVLVAFELGSERSPYVVGSFYNGENAQPGQYDDDDKLKIIRTRSGNEIIFDDSGILTVRNEKNSFELNCSGDGLLTIKTVGDMVIKADKDIRIEAGKNFMLKAGERVEFESGKKMTANSGDSMELKANKNMAIESVKTMDIKAGGDLSVKATKNTSVAGMKTKVEGSAGTELSSGAVTVVKGAMVKIN